MMITQRKEPALLRYEALKLSETALKSSLTKDMATKGYGNKSACVMLCVMTALLLTVGRCDPDCPVAILTHRRCRYLILRSAAI